MIIDLVEIRRKKIFFNFCFFIALPLLLFFSILDYADKNRNELIADTAILLTMVSGFYVINFIKEFLSVYRIVFTVLSSVFLFFAGTGADNETVLFWLFIFPLFYVFFFGKKEGAIWSALFLLLLFILYMNPFSMNIHQYDQYIALRFLIVYILITVSIFGLEFSRVGFMELISRRNSELKIKNNELLKSEKQLRISEERWKKFFDNAGDSIFIIDPETKRIVDCNKDSYTRLGYTKDEMHEMSVYELSHNLDREGVDSFFNRLLVAKGGGLETLHKKKSGESLPVEISVVLITLGEEKLAMAIVRDISRRHKIEKEKDNLLEEKELLMLELNHRIANNLSIINSMISMEILESGDSSNDTLELIKNRIHAIGMVHQKLYQTEKFENIESVNFIEGLIDDIQVAMIGHRKNIIITKDLASVQITTKQAVSLGIIINELIINSIKYAFPGSREGVIAVKSEIIDSESERYYGILIEDNGVGRGEVKNGEKDGATGSVVIDSFIKDLNGFVDIINKNGYSVYLRFPIN